MDTVKQTKEGTPMVKLTQEEYNEKIAKLELREKELNLQDLEERLAERQMKREMKYQNAQSKGNILRQNFSSLRSIQGRCNHKKGGNGAEGVIAGQGDDSQYAVIKHMYANGDIWIRCLRCKKWWTPPSQADFETKEGYLGALAEYKTALDFQTRNVMSKSVQFKWGDNGEYYRSIMKNSSNL